jgi:hypothetical protein
MIRRPASHRVAHRQGPVRIQSSPFLKGRASGCRSVIRRSSLSGAPSVKAGGDAEDVPRVRHSENRAFLCRTSIGLRATYEFREQVGVRSALGRVLPRHANLPRCSPLGCAERKWRTGVRTLRCGCQTVTLSGAYSTWYGSWPRPTPRC